MSTNVYTPEGSRLNTPENREYITSVTGLERAMACGKILEGIAMLCDSDLNLHVDLYGTKGIIEKEEAVYCRQGETQKDIAIITRVGKPVCFKVIGVERTKSGVVARLSRRAAQLECERNFLADLIPGDVIPAKVTHLEQFGAFVDIGCGISSLLSVDCISVSRIAHPSDRLKNGMMIDVVVKNVDEGNGRIFVSRRELLGTWEENVEFFRVGQTVAGIVRSIESYGIFIELTPNLAGLAELRDDRPGMDVQIGSTATVFIKNIIPERMKVKLVLIDMSKEEPPSPPQKMFIDPSEVKHLSYWRYSPLCCDKVIETVFE